MTPTDPIRFAARVARTLDLDIMIEVNEAAARALAAALQGEFYVDADAAGEAVHHGSTFNAIHVASAMKVDFFIAEDRAAVRKQLDRRQPLAVEDVVLWFYAPEDIIVRKLLWFRMGGEVSERQWNDVASLLRVRRGGLDEAYLTRAAEEFAVGDLLARART